MGNSLCATAILYVRLSVWIVETVEWTKLCLERRLPSVTAKFTHITVRKYHKIRTLFRKLTTEFVDFMSLSIFRRRFKADLFRESYSDSMI